MLPADSKDKSSTGIDYVEVVEAMSGSRYFTGSSRALCLSSGDWMPDFLGTQLALGI
jgi:hypothetical protein